MSSQLAKRYSLALLENLDDSASKESEEILATLADAWRNDVSFRSLMLNPAVDVVEREKVLASLVGNTNAKTTLQNFLLLLFRNSRMNILPEVAKTFAALRAELQNVLGVEVVSAYEMSTEERSVVTDKIKASLGREPQLLWRVDTTLLGGLLVKIGDTVLDYSLLGSLERMKRAMVQPA